MPTFADDQLVTAAILNLLPSGVNALGSLVTGAVAPRAYVPTVGASINTTHSVATGTDTIITMDTAGINNDVMWTAAVNHLTIKTAGIYVVWAQATFDANTTGVRALHILLNGTSVTTNQVGAAGSNALSLVGGSITQIMARTPPLSLAVNATLYLSVFQNSGGALNTLNTISGTYLCATRIGN